MVAVGRESHRGHQAGVAGEVAQLRPGARCPRPGPCRPHWRWRSVAPSGAKATDQTASVWPVRVAQLRPGARCPRSGRCESSPAVASSGAIRGEGHRRTGPVWPVRLAQLVPVRGVPDPGGAVTASGGDAGAVGREGHCLITRSVWPVSWRRLRCRCAASQIRAVPSSAGGGDGRSVRGEGHRPDHAGVAGELAQLGSGARRPRSGPCHHCPWWRWQHRRARRPPTRSPRYGR